VANATTDTLLDIFRSKLNGAADDVILLELYNVVDEVAREALRIAAPTNRDAAPDTWLPSDQWVPNFQPIQHGVLARMYAQASKPWANAELAKFHLAQYDQYLSLARAESSASPATYVERIFSTVRTQLPAVRDASIKLELYNVIDKIRKEALRLAPLSEATVSPVDWLPAADWEPAYQTIIHGVLYRLQLQHGKPWTNPDIGKANYGIYQTELERLRGDQSTAPRGGIIRLLDEARPVLPGAPDNLIEIALFATVREFLRESTVWRDYITFTTTTGLLDYTLIPSENALPYLLLYVINGNEVPIAATMEQPGELTLDHDPGNAQQYTAVVALTVLDPLLNTGQPNFPTWIMDLYAETIADGLIGRMMAHGGKVWSNPQMSVYHLRRFRNGIAQAKVAADRKNTRRQAWRFPFESRISSDRRF
jgi:hypothetical protein